MDGRLFPGLFLAAVFLLPGLAKADAVNAEWSSTARALSMGNVGIASSDDPSSASFYNPAALARAKKTTIEIFNPQLDLGGGVFSLSHSFADWAKQASYSKSLPLLKAQPGTASSLAISVFPNVTAQNFSFGVLLSGKSSAYYNGDKDAYYYHSRKLLVPSLGMSAALLASRLKLGVSVRGVQVNEADTVTPGSTSTVGAFNNSRNGFGIGLDGGMLMTMPMAALPTLGLVARNLGGIAFPTAPVIPLGGATSTRHELIKTSYDAGLSVSPKFGQRDQLTFATDYRDMLNSTGTVMVRKINVGLEFASMKYFFFRLGFSQGYWTAGFGLNSKAGAIDIGTYGEELDATGHAFLDRRYSLRLTRRF